MKYSATNDYEVLYLISENNEDAYSYIYEKYKPFIKKNAYSLYRKYKNTGIEYDDLIQEGMYGLSEAIKKYDINEGNMFYTLAVLCIKREMERLIIKSIRNKQNILNFAYSLEEEIAETGLILQDIIYDDTKNTDYCFFLLENTKTLLELKYDLKDKYAPVYELKINGFTNKEIAELLELKYKDVDNYLRSIKNTLRKKLISYVE